MKKNILLAIQCLLLIVLSSCVREDLEVGTSYCYVGVDFSYDQTKTSVTVDPLDIENVQLFAFSSQTGSLLYYDTNAGQLAGQPVALSTNKINSISWCLPVGEKMDIYAVANWSELPLYETIDELTSSDQLVFTIESLEELNKMSSLPMTSNKLFTCTGNGEKLNLMMRKYFDKYKLNLDFGEKDVTVKSVKVKNVNNKIHLFQNNAAKSSSDILTEFDYATQSELSGIITLIVPENRQTSVNLLTTDFASLEEQITESFNNSDRCTSVQIEFESTLVSKTNSGNFMFYFGTGLNNYDVRGGYETVINVDGRQFVPKATLRFFTRDGKPLYLFCNYITELAFTYENINFEDIKVDDFALIADESHSVDISGNPYYWHIPFEVLSIEKISENEGILKVRRNSSGWSDDEPASIHYKPSGSISSEEVNYFPFSDVVCSYPVLYVTGPNKVLVDTEHVEYRLMCEFTLSNGVKVIEDQTDKANWHIGILHFSSTKDNHAYNAKLGTSDAYDWNVETIMIQYYDNPNFYHDITIYTGHEYSLKQLYSGDQSYDRYEYEIEESVITAKGIEFKSAEYTYTTDFDGGYTDRKGPLVLYMELDDSYDWTNLKQGQVEFKVNTSNKLDRNGNQYSNYIYFNDEFEATFSN